MYSLSDNLYREAAQKLIEAIDDRSYVSESIEWQHDDIDCRLTLSAVVYRHRREMPEGTTSVITDIVPVWWEFHTICDEGEMFNDFSFAVLKEFIF